jgi:hypothetical protein
MLLLVFIDPLQLLNLTTNNLGAFKDVLAYICIYNYI